MLGEVIDGALDGLALAQQVQMTDHQVGLQSGGLVIVDLGALFQRHVVTAVVIIVVAQDGDVIAEALDQIVHQGSLAGAGTAGDANNQNVFHIFFSFIC